MKWKKEAKLKEIGKMEVNFLERYKAVGHVIHPFKLPATIRVNTLKTSVRELVQRLVEKGVSMRKISYLQNGYYAKSKFSIGTTLEYLLGHYYIQEAASQMPVEFLNCSKNDVVLDACAAPGGKTSQISQYMENKGTLIALDIREARVISLRNNLARMGVSNTRVYNINALDCNCLGLKFDKILLDAPCSGNLITDNYWIKKRDIHGVIKNSKVQKSLLLALSKILKNGGELIYSTCSLEYEEDEAVVQYGLDELGLSLVKLKSEFNNKEFDGTIKMWPDLTNTQGFFIAKFKKW